ncbi:PHP domain-containing protein [Pseudomonadota bacterium]
MSHISKKYDLHCHSTASDGELSPDELMRLAASKGIQAIALTDHDVTDGLQEAAATAAELGMEFISGVEISASWNSKHLVHIVGLNFDVTNQALQQGLSGIRDQRNARAIEMAQRLESKAKIENVMEGVQRYANGKILSRTHFAQFLYKEGHVKSLQNAFDRYLGDGKPAYVKSEWSPLEDAVNWITGAGGVAVIAHPARYKLSATKLRALIEDFKAYGGLGVEVVSGSQNKNDSLNIADYAKRFDLHASMGSDYHGPSQSWLKMGAIPPLPSDCVPIWEAWDDVRAIEGVVEGNK